MKLSVLYFVVSILDELLGKLANAGVGCYIGNILVGALAYADVIILLAPTARALRLLLGVCYHYSLEYSIAKI